MTEDFFELRSRASGVTGEILADFFIGVQRKDDHYYVERNAAIKLQSLYRAAKVRARWHLVQKAAAYISRIMRGWLGRMKARALLMHKAHLINKKYFDHCATTIQKVFRGYWCRAYIHCMYTRKEYLSTVSNIGDRTNRWLRDYNSKMQDDATRQQEQQKRGIFNSLASQLHHLVSTQVIPGVYNPPFSDQIPTAFNIPIEQHLRLQSTAKIVPSLRRPHLNKTITNPAYGSTVRGLDHAEKGHTDAAKIRGGPPQNLAQRKPLLTRTANVGRLQEIQGPFRMKDQIDLSNAKAYDQYRSVQSASLYSKVEDERRLEERLSKLTRIGADEFVSRKAPMEKQKPTVLSEARYMDRPVEFRQDYHELPKIQDKPPFYTCGKKDRDFSSYNDTPYLTGAQP